MGIKRFGSHLTLAPRSALSFRMARLLALQKECPVFLANQTVVVEEEEKKKRSDLCKCVASIHLHYINHF